MTRALILSILSLIFTLSISAQNLVGKVFDAHSNENLIGVHVYIPELKTGTMTGISGDFELQDLPFGTFQIQFSYLGYQVLVENIDIKEGRNTIKAGLHESIIESKEVIVSVASHHHPEHTPIKIDQLSNQQLLQTAGTLSEGLSALPGIDFQSMGAGIHKPNIRGLSGNRILVLTDGLKLDNQQWGADHSLGINEIGIDRVEVIKGPASIIYGSDAMGGVINFINEKPAKIGYFEGDYNLKLSSVNNGVRTDFGIKDARKYFRYGVRVGHQNYNDYTMGQGNQVSNSRYNETGVKSQLAYVNRKMSTQVNYNYALSNYGIIIPGLIVEPGRLMQLPYQMNTTHVLGSESKLFFGPSKLLFNVGYIANNRQEFEDGSSHAGHSHAHVDLDPSIAPINMQLNTFRMNVQYHMPMTSFEDFSWIVGLNNSTQNNINKGIEKLVPSATTKDLGLYSLMEWDVADKTHIQFGSRFDNRDIQAAAFAGNDAFKYNFANFSGNFGGAFEVNENMLFRSSVATGFRSPNLSELSINGVHHGSQRFEIGNNELKHERNIELDFSMEYHTAHLFAELTVFNNDISDYIFIRATGETNNNFLVYAYQQTDANIRGIEYNFDWHPHPVHWLHLNVSGNFMDGKDVANNTNLPLIAANNIKPELKIEKSGKKVLKESFIKIAYEYYYDKNDVAPLETTTPSYGLLNVAIGNKIEWEKQIVEISLSANNLTDVKYFNHLSTLKNYNLFNPGRNIQFNIKVPFQFKNGYETKKRVTIPSNRG